MARPSAWNSNQDFYTKKGVYETMLFIAGELKSSIQWFLHSQDVDKGYDGDLAIDDFFNLLVKLKGFLTD